VACGHGRGSRKGPVSTGLSEGSRGVRLVGRDLTQHRKHPVTLSDGKSSLRIVCDTAGGHSSGAFIMVIKTHCFPSFEKLEML
jgi:hypothetical protein